MIVITGGGTGGHLNIAKCLLESMRKKNIACLYIGSENGQDKSWFENEKEFQKKYFLSSKGVVNQNKFKKITSLVHILKLSLECKKILQENNVKAVFSVGGYSAAPASFAALLSQIPLFIHEQNSKSGSLNTLLKPFCTQFFSAFEKESSPYPVANQFFEKSRIRNKLNTIIFLGGSQGAQFINELAFKLAPSLHQRGIKIIHQCGKNELENYKQKYKNINIPVDLFDFTSKLEEKMHEADLAISRSGASTLFELCANQLPSIFIPYPFAAKNHQYFNAKFLQDQSLCQIFQQKQIVDEKTILQSIFKLDLQKISQQLQGISEKNGADKLVEAAQNKVKF